MMPVNEALQIIQSKPIDQTEVIKSRELKIQFQCPKDISVYI